VGPNPIPSQPGGDANASANRRRRFEKRGARELKNLKGRWSVITHLWFCPDHLIVTPHLPPPYPIFSPSSPIAPTSSNQPKKKTNKQMSRFFNH